MAEILGPAALVGSTGRELSGSIWGDFPHVGISGGMVNGVVHYDDFQNFGGTLTSTTGTYGGYKSYQDTSNTIGLLATEVGGVVQIATDGTNNDESWLGTGYGAGGMVKFLTPANGGTKLWFEARVRFGQIVTQNWFIGLAEEGVVAADAMVSDAGALADKDMVGFAILEGASSTLTIKYNTASGGGVTTHNSAAKTIVASTWYKLGFKYEPSRSANGRITFFIDGTQVGATTYPGVTNFPDGEELIALFGGKEGAAAAMTADIDWWKIGQVF